MGIAADTSQSTSLSPGRLLVRAVGLLVALVLAYEVVHFFLRDPLHYIIDPTEKSFGIYWPRRIPLLLHIAGGTVALFTGPFQLWTGLRRRNLAIHRLTGLLYIGGVVLASVVGIYMSFFTSPRAVGIPLFVLASTWLLTIAMAFLAIKRRRINDHKEWMIRGYVLTFAFVSIRALTDMPILQALGPARDPTISWICWVVPLVITEMVFAAKRLMPPAVSGRSKAR